MTEPFLYQLTRRSSTLERYPKTDGIMSVNGQSGADITLTTNDITENTSLYYTAVKTDARFTTLLGVAGKQAVLNGAGRVTSNQLAKIQEAYPITYQELAAKVAANTLVPTTYYNITDFQTIYQIPKTAIIRSCAIEPLVVQAMTVNSISMDAISVSTPNDIIQYELVDMSLGNYGIKGRITYRKDPIKNIATYYDWRHITFRRWRNSALQNGYVAITGTGAYVDYLTFNLDEINENILIEKCFDGAEILPNNVVRGECIGMMLGYDSYDNTFADRVNDVIAETTMQLNTILVYVKRVHIGMGFSGNVVGNVLNGDSIRTVTIGHKCKNNQLRSTITGSSIEHNVSNCTFTGTIDASTIFNGYVGHTVNGNLSRCMILSNYHKNINGDAVGQVFGLQSSHYSHVSNNYQMNYLDGMVGVDTTTRQVTVTLPSVIEYMEGQVIIIKDETGNGNNMNITISGKGTDKINNSVQTLKIDTTRGMKRLYAAGTRGWFTC